ncbi:acyl-CoA thioesterase [Peijinzhouia sedimentorum]
MLDYEKLKNPQKTTESRVVIRFQDCDPLRHLNNAKYFDYFFNAREDQVPKLYGLQVMDFINAYKAAWVVYQHQIGYIRPAMVGEWVRIFSRIVWFDDYTSVVEYFMTNDDKTQLKTVLWTTLKYVDFKSGQRVPHQGAVVEYLEAVSLTDFDPSQHDFNVRVKEIKTEIKGWAEK